MTNSRTLHRVAVTGLGLVTPLGLTRETSWQAALAGISGIGPVTQCDVSDIPSKVAGEVKDFNPEAVIPTKDLKKCDRFIQLGWVAAHEALTQAKLLDENTGQLPQALQERAGTMLGSGIGGLNELERTYGVMAERGAKRISPFLIPSILINMLGGQVSMAYGLKGANVAPVSACATGSHAIGEAMRLIQRGEQDVMVAGGAEACICRLAMGGFAAARALSTGFNETPQQASRPFDTARDGFVMGEGAGVLVLESWDHAVARGAEILAELVGFGQTADAYHMTAPAENGEGAQRAMQQALADAGLRGADVDYINAHATSTPTGDVAECTAIKGVCGPEVVISATKSMTGHLLGATGAMEAGFSILALRDQQVPPTINVQEQDPACDLDVVPHTARQMPLTVVMSNTFGFGGTNATLVFKKS